jgi:putative ABC transport system permease protein
MQDLRYAFRTLRKQPLFTLVAVLTLALGIGANTALFSLVYQILLRPLPYPEAQRLVFVWNRYRDASLSQAAVSIPDYLDRKTQAPALEDAALMTPRTVNLIDAGNPEQLRALAVTPSFFSTLRRQPVIGRAFSEDEARPGADRAVILTDALWNSHFGSDPAIVGRFVRVNGDSYRVVGVLPSDFEMPVREISLLMPFAFTPQQMSDGSRGDEFSIMIARLRAGATIEQANAQFATIVARVIDRLPARAAFMRTSGFGGFAKPFRDELVGDVRTPLYVLQGAVVLVLLIACLNVANLFLMRATGRTRELAIRTTLGAARGRIVRQLLTEGLLLSGAGSIAGLAVAWVGLKGLIAMTAAQLPESTGASLQPIVLLFTLALGVLTGVVFGLVPAFAIAKRNTTAFLKEDSTRGSAGRRTAIARTILVVAETAIAVVLLIGAGLLLKSYARIQSVNPGFSPDDVLTAQVALPRTRYPDAATRVRFWNEVLEKARAIPGVTATGLTSNLPFNGNVWSGSYMIVGAPMREAGAVPHARHEIVGGDFFAALQIPLIEGRTFNAGDTHASPPVAVIDEYLARKYFAGRSPLGRQIDRGGPPYTIVGVVGTINSIDLGQPVTKERIYYAAAQEAPRASALVLKTTLDPIALVPQVRAVVRAVDPEQPIADVRTMDQWIARSLQTRRTPTTLLMLFGVAALVLSAIGIYGVLAFGVAQRVREFGIRQALGADRRSILSMVFAQGLRTAGAGILLGLAGSFALTKYLQSLLFHVTAFDPTVFVGATAMLVGVAAVACYAPAAKATRVDPMVALREM